jgi:hypothetical protein
VIQAWGGWCVLGGGQYFNRLWSTPLASVWAERVQPVLVLLEPGRCELLRRHGDSIVDGSVEGEHQRLGHVRCLRSVVDTRDHQESTAHSNVGEIDHLGVDCLQGFLDLLADGALANIRVERLVGKASVDEDFHCAPRRIGVSTRPPVWHGRQQAVVTRPAASDDVSLWRVLDGCRRVDQNGVIGWVGRGR